MNASFEHVPVVPPRRVSDVPPIEEVWLERFADVATPDIADHVGLHYTMDPSIHPLYSPIGRLVGRALTVKAWPGDGLAVHGAVALVQPGDVLVIDGRGETNVSRGGFNMLVGPRRAGLRGIVIDGALRDGVDFGEVDFPVFGRAATPHASTKRRPGEINVPVACGGVVVEAGDLVVADAEGVVVVPRAHIAVVWEAIEAARGRPEPTAEVVEQRVRQRWDNYERAFHEAGGAVEAFGSTHSD